MDKAKINALLKEKIQNLQVWGKQLKIGNILSNVGEYSRNMLKKIKAFKFKKAFRYAKKISRKLSDSWKLVLSCLFCFLFFYYIIGSLLVENMSIRQVYQLPKEKSEKSETLNAMAFLINREIDAKMWTPNLPFVFPAYILDNMPNFQIGIMSAVRGASITVKNFRRLTPAQTERIKKADELLRYPPNIWIMSRKGTFGLAPSSNAQYRKARRELLKINDEPLVLEEQEFNSYLSHLAKSLRLYVQKNDSQIIEHSSQILDTKSDDVFYKARGFAFGAWQIALAAGADFKSVIVRNNVYTEWTYLISSLQKTAEFKPLYIRNGKLGGLTGANHLIVQNYYLERALVAVLNIQNKLQENHAD